MENQSAAKVGLAAALGLAALLAAWWYLSHFAWGTFPIFVTFDDTKGLPAKSQVRLSGVVIGEVAAVELDGRQPLVRLQIHEKYRPSIPADSRISIATGILITNPIVEIVPGRSTELVQPGQRYRGVEGAGILAQLSPETEQIVRQLSRTMETLTPRLARTMDRVEGILRRTDGMMADLQVVTAQTRKLASDPQIHRTMHSTLANVEAMVSDAHRTQRTLSTELTTMVKRNGGKVDELVTGLFDLLQRFTDTVDASRGLVTRLADQVNDPRLLQSMQETLDLTRTTIARFNQVASDIHQLIGDAGVQSDLKSTLSTLRDTTETGKRVTEDVARLVERLNLPKGGPQFGIGQPGLSVDFSLRTDKPQFRSSVGMRFPIGNNNLVDVGLYDFAERNTLIAQYGTQISGLGLLRYGLYASKLGTGFDVRTTPNTKFVFDAYDPNRLTVDARALLRLNQDFSLWVGADSLFRHTTPIVGVRLTR